MKLPCRSRGKNRGSHSVYKAVMLQRWLDLRIPRASMLDMKAEQSVSLAELHIIRSRQAEGMNEPTRQHAPFHSSSD
jgi:hypothetical protein